MTISTTRPIARAIRFLLFFAALSTAALSTAAHADPPANAVANDPLPEGSVWEGIDERHVKTPALASAPAPAGTQSDAADPGAEDETPAGDLHKCTLTIVHRNAKTGKVKFRITRTPPEEEWIVTCNVAGERLTSSAIQSQSAAHKLKLNASGKVADETITLDYQGKRITKNGDQSIDEPISGTIVVNLAAEPPPADAGEEQGEDSDSGSDAAERGNGGKRGRNKQGAARKNAKKTLTGTEFRVQNGPRRPTGCQVHILKDDPQTGEFRFKLERDNDNEFWIFSCFKDPKGVVSVRDIKPTLMRRGRIDVNCPASGGEYKNNVFRLKYEGYRMARVKAPFSASFEVR